MNPILKNILAVVAGIITGSMVNMEIVQVSGSIIALPAGADVTSVEGLKASLHLFEPRHFIMPFLAHALGTFVGAFIAVLIAGNAHKIRIALGIGIFFMIGGIANVLMLPSPVWFTVVDLVGAYLPMAYLGAMLVPAKK